MEREGIGFRVLWYAYRMPSPLIHIGYHKTASSWLQRKVFHAADEAGVVSYVAGPRHRDIDLRSLFSRSTLSSTMRARRERLSMRVYAPPKGETSFP